MSRGSCGNPACKRPSTDPICWDCTRDLSQALGRIGDLVDLLTAASRVAHNGTGDGGAPHYPALPFDADLSMFVVELHTMLVACARDLSETRGIPFMPLGFVERSSVDPDFIGPLPRGIRYLPPGARRLPAGYIVTTAEIAAWLRIHVRQLRMCDSAGETVFEVGRAIDHGLALAAGPVVTLYRGPCPTVVGKDDRGRFIRCGAQLYAPRGDAYIRCRRCDVVHDASAFEQRHLADAGQMVYRFTRIQRILRELGEPITDRTLAAWIRGGRVKPAGWQRPDGTITTGAAHKGDPAMYRLADVRRVRAESRAGRGAIA